MIQMNIDFFKNDAVTLAKDLIGKVLVRQIGDKTIQARIVETEAYMGASDKACHSYNYLRTKRTEPMYNVGGTIYVYLIYGLHHCFNIVANEKEVPEAVLVRAVEVLSGVEYLKKNPRNHHPDMDLKTNGPGKLCKSLAIDLGFNDLHILENEKIFLFQDDFVVTEKDIVKSKRINIDYAEEDKNKLYRFYLKNNEFVSHPR